MTDDINFIPAPVIDWTPDKLAAFDQLYTQLSQHGAETHFDYHCPYPKHEFLCYLVEYHQALLHGSNNPNIAVFEPRAQTDYVGRPIKAVFASPDGIWPIYFAIVDRTHQRVSLRNSCRWVTGENGQRQKIYYFSINEEMLANKPWIPGTIYVLPRATFEQVHDRDGNPLEEWISPVPVKPLGKLLILPQEFPYLDAIEGHPNRLNHLAAILLTCFTHKEDLEDGYAFQYDWHEERLSQMAELLGEMREALPLVRGEIIMEAQDGPLWLRIRGGLAVKEIMTSALQQLTGD